MMGLRLIVRSVLLLLALVVVAVQPSAGQADDDNDNAAGKPKPAPAAPPNARPDLRVKFEGFSPANLRHTITFRVTNDGAAPSSKETKARIQALDPEPPNISDSEDVGGLLPGQSKLVYYGIGACKGQKVRASVNDPLDSNTANDFDVVELTNALCGTASAPSAPANPDLDPSRIVNTGISAIPERLQKGEHRLELPPSVLRENRMIKDPCEGGLEEPAGGNVGFSYVGYGGCNDYGDNNYVRQLLVDFDLQWLEDVEQKLVYRVELRYDERILSSTHTDAHDVPSTSCVGRLGLAPLGYDSAIKSGQLLGTEEAGETRLTDGWLVTRDINFSLVPGYRFQGFVLHGWSEHLSVEDSYASCLSQVDNVRLWLHYSIL